jgi:hypothetical protein
MAEIKKPFGGASTDSGGNYNFNVTYSAVNPRTGANGKWILIQSEASRPPSVFAADDTAGINKFLDSTNQTIGNYLTRTLDNVDQAQRDLDAAQQSGNTGAAESARQRINYYNKEAAATRQNLAASQAVSGEVSTNSAAAIEEVTAATPVSTDTTTTVAPQTATPARTFSSEYKSARTFSDPDVQVRYDNLMKEQPLSLWDDVDTQNEAAEQAQQEASTARQNSSAGAETTTAANQTAGAAVAESTTTPPAPPATAVAGQLTADQLADLEIINAAYRREGLAEISPDSPEAAQEVNDLNRTVYNNDQDARATGAIGSYADYDEFGQVSDSSPVQELESEEFQRLTDDTETDYDEFGETVPANVVGSSGTGADRPPAYRPDGPTEDGGYYVNISGVNQPRANAAVSVGPSTGTNYTPQPQPNPLHQYASYTYNLSLHCLTQSQYNQLINNPSTTFKPQKTLIGGANRYNGPERDSAFQEEFYFDNLKFETVISMTQSSRGFNVYNLNFTLIEPYGLTLLNRILDLSRQINMPNYVEIPYLLEIKFFGSDDTGKYANIDQQTKLIPIRIINMTIKAGTKGSEYQITAVPYNNLAHLQSVQTTKANYEITSRTVGEVFASAGAGAASVESQIAGYNLANNVNQQAQANQVAINQSNQLLAASGVNEVDLPPDSTRQAPGATASATPPPSLPAARITASSFTHAFNLWQKYTASSKYQTIPDEIAFVIDPEIASSKIVEPKQVDPGRTSVQTANGTNPASQSTNLPATSPKPGVDFTKSIFSINAGSNINTIINNMIVNSEYIQKQISDSNTQQSGAGSAGARSSPIKWFKITSKIELKQFDSTRNLFGKKITYYIQKYSHYNMTFPGASKARPTGSVKNYNYIYTGKNTDILDFNIQFNALYTNQVMVNRANMLALNENPGAGNSGQNNAKAETQVPFSIDPNMITYFSGAQSNITGGFHDTSQKENASNFADSIYTAFGADLLKLDLKIIGDPQFIKQDEVLFSSRGNNQQLIAGGSLAMDSGEIFAQVTFKTPVDIDEATGLSRANSKWKEVYWSGLYKVQMVSNEFTRGKFTQTLTLIRLRDKPPIPAAPSTSGAGRPTTGQTTAAGQQNSSNNTSSATAGTPLQVRDDEGNILTIAGNETVLVDATGGVTTGQVLDTPAAAPPASDAITSVPGEFGDVPNDSDPNFIPLREVANNGPTNTIEANSDSNGEPYVGASGSTTQAVAPPQTNPDGTQSPPAQTEPRPAPATAAERQSDASTAELESLQAQRTNLEQQYEALYAPFAPKQDQLRAYDKVLAEIEDLLKQVSPNSEQQAKLLALKIETITSQNQLLREVRESVNQMQAIKSQAAEVDNKIRTIKANTGNIQ